MRAKLKAYRWRMSSCVAQPCSWRNGLVCPSKSPHASLESLPMSFENPVFVVLYVVALWTGVGFVISLIGGWFDLGRIYRARQPFHGQCWHFQDAQFRLIAGYHNVVSVGANAEGLFLSVFFLFRSGHPPLFIPWQDISVRPGRYFWFRVYRFEFRQVPSVRLRLKEKLGTRIQVAAGPAWPGDRAATGAAF